MTFWEAFDASEPLRLIVLALAMEVIALLGMGATAIWYIRRK